MVVPRDAARTTTVGAATSKSGTKGDFTGDEVGNMTSAHPKTAPIPIANANSTSTATTATARGSAAVSPPSSTSPASSVTHNGTSRRSRERRRGTLQMEDLPGTRVGPDDGPWPKSYEILETEEDVWKELRTLARPHRAVFVNERGIQGSGDNQGELTPNGDSERRHAPATTAALISIADSVNFQPCRNLKTQDRYVVTQLDIHGELWTLTGVFDGMFSVLYRLSGLF